MCACGDGCGGNWGPKVSVCPPEPPLSILDCDGTQEKDEVGGAVGGAGSVWA